MIKNLGGSLFVFIVFLELGLRATGLYTTFSEGSTGDFWFEWEHQRDTAHYSHFPDSTFYSSNGEYEWKYESNHYGYREHQIPDSSSSKIRLFTFGDSFTEGLGTSFDSTWPRRLELLVNQNEIDLELYNCGMSGSDPYYQWWSLKHLLLQKNPTHVIVSMNDSDFDDITIRGGYSRFQDNGNVRYNPAPNFLPVYRMSHIVRMVVHDILSYDAYLIPRSNRKKLRSSMVDSLSTILRDINWICKSKGVKFLTVIHPVPHAICFEDSYSKTEVLALDSVNFDFPVVRMYLPLREKMIGKNCSQYHWKTDSHFNGKGYQMFGDIIHEQILKNYPDFWNQVQQPDSLTAHRSN